MPERRKYTLPLWKEDVDGGKREWRAVVEILILFSCGGIERLHSFFFFFLIENFAKWRRFIGLPSLL